MIPKPIITHWRSLAPWPIDDQVEQDLVISRALVQLFNNEYLKDKVAFRGGTALHKLIFPSPLRYSEDIDLNRLEKGPAKLIIDAVRASLQDMLGEAKKIKSTKNSVKIFFDYKSIGGNTSRLKIEINTRETLPQENLQKIPYSVNSEYFKGEALINAFDREEMIGTKIRALYQRNKGRDLFDLFKLSEIDGIDWNKVTASFLKLKIGASAKNISANLELKMQDSEFLEDINPLLPSNVKYDVQEAFDWFMNQIIPKI